MRHPITGRRISREKYEAQQVLFAKRYAEMKAEEQTKASSTMTKKHFIALADALRAEKPGTNWDPNKMVQWELDVKAIANVCAAHNPNFNRERWLGYIAGTNGPNGGAR